MAELPQNNTVETQDEKGRLKKYISGRRIAFAVILMGFLLAKYLWNQPEVTPYKMSAIEKQLNDEFNAKKTRNKMWRVIGYNAAYDPKKELEPDQLVRVRLPGENIITIYGKDEDGKITKKSEAQSPQVIVTPAHCADVLIELNKCANKLGTDLRVNSAFRSHAHQQALHTRLKEKDPGATVAQAGTSPHSQQAKTAKCVFDIARSDAYGRTPIGRDENGNVIFADKEAANNSEIDEKVKASVLGMHVMLAEECAMDMGGNGGICGPNRDPVHFTFPSDSECKPGSAEYLRKRQLLLDDPPWVDDGLDEIWSDLKLGRWSPLKNYAKKKGKAILEVGKNGINWVGEKGKELKEWWKKKDQEKKNRKRGKKKQKN